MSEENTGVQAQDENETTEVDANSLLEENKTLQAELENLKKISSGQDRKNTELLGKITQFEKILSEKEQSKKTVEEQIAELQKQIQERDTREARAKKEAEVSRTIAEFKLHPEFDFDYLMKFETTELMKEKAQERAENYKALKEEGFKERASGTAPKRGDAETKDLSTLSMTELNRLAIEKPELKPQIVEAIKNRKR